MLLQILIAFGCTGLVMAGSFGEQLSESGIRHSFLITGTKTAMVDERGEISWEISKKSRDGEVLANGNVVACQYGSRGDDMPDALEINPEGKVVWEFKAPAFRGIHEIDVLTTNGKPAGGRR